jgi:hypothetical protein
MRRARAIALLVVTGCFGVAVACSDTQPPLGKGNDVISDVDGSGEGAPEQQGDDEAGADSPFAPVDSGYPKPPDGYAPFAWCTQCGCPSGSFCFGGGSGYESFSGDCHADAGPLPDGGLAVGCYAFPPPCANEPSCECLIQAVSPYTSPCYPVCSITTNIVYCPNP